MALPSSGTITMDMVKAELGITGTLSLTDSRVRALAGKPTGTINLSDLRGKSAAPPVSVTVSGYMNVMGSGATTYNRGTYTCTVSGGTPTSYQWIVIDPMGMLVYGSTTGSSILLTGPTYNSLGFNQSSDFTIRVSVKVGGIDYISNSLNDFYTFGDLM